jgi:hypothetical protein
MKRLHHTNNFTLNERRLIYDGPLENSKAQPSATPETPTGPEVKTQPQAADATSVRVDKADKALSKGVPDAQKPEPSTPTSPDASKPDQNNQQLTPDEKKLAENVKSKFLKSTDGLAAQVPYKIDESLNIMPNFSGARENAIDAKEIVALQEFQQIATTLTPEEKKVLLKSQKLSSTGILRIDGSESHLDGSEAIDIPEPKTHGERLERDMKSALDELKNAEGTAKITALIKVLGSASEYIQRAFSGKLGEAIEQKKPENAPAGAPENGANKPPQTPAEAAQQKLEENAKAALERDKKPIDQQQNIEEVKQKNAAERERNATEMKELGTSIDETKKENDTFIDQRGALEKQANALQGEEGSESKQQTIKDKIDAVNKKIDANKELITKLDARRDALDEKNKKLIEEDKALDRMKEEAGEAMKKSKELMSVINKAVKESGLEGTLPTLDVEMGKDGKPVITVTGGSKEIRAMIQEQATKNKWPIEMREGPVNAAAPEQTSETQPSANEIQNRRLMIVNSQIRSLTGDGIKVKGSAYTGASFVMPDGMEVRYETQSRQWQAKHITEKEWKDPTNLKMQNADIANRLKIFKVELGNLQKEEGDAKKREQAAEFATSESVPFNEKQSTQERISQSEKEKVIVDLNAQSAKNNWTGRYAMNTDGTITMTNVEDASEIAEHLKRYDSNLKVEASVITFTPNSDWWLNSQLQVGHMHETKG